MFKAVTIISANVEWRAVLKRFLSLPLDQTPYGETFQTPLPGLPDGSEIHFLHGGWGKISAAASAQYAIDRWQPDLLVNLGTCGGFEGEIERGAIILVEKTIVYDIIEQMGDYDAHIAHYSTVIDNDWLAGQYPIPVRPALLVSGDRDLLVEDIPQLKARYGAVAGDWESGAIAFVAAHNRVRALILRGVTDLVGASGGEAYGNLGLFETAAAQVMDRLVESLPAWLSLAIDSLRIP